MVSLLKINHSTNPLMKIISILIKINEKYAIYNQVNTSEVGDLYFQLFKHLTIKTINDPGFNIWKTCTTIEKIKSLDFMMVV